MEQNRRGKESGTIGSRIRNLRNRDGMSQEQLPYTSIDAVFSLDQVNEALDKVKRGGSKWQTIIKVHESRSTN